MWARFSCVCRSNSSSTDHYLRRSPAMFTHTCKYYELWPRSCTLCAVDIIYTSWYISRYVSTMSYVPPQYTPYVYTMHNVRALDTHFHVLLDAHHCADYLQSDARGEILMPT
jgi:hypothetical protein